MAENSTLGFAKKALLVPRNHALSSKSAVAKDPAKLNYVSSFQTADFNTLGVDSFKIGNPFQTDLKFTWFRRSSAKWSLWPVPRSNRRIELPYATKFFTLFCQQGWTASMRLLEGTVFDRPPHCERCGQPESECQCPPLPVASTFLPPEKQTARLALEKRKKGKSVTIVRGLSARESDLPALLSRLKTTLGAGGTMEGEELEIQGEHLERVRQLLSQWGYKVKG